MAQGVPKKWVSGWLEQLYFILDLRPLRFHLKISSLSNDTDAILPSTPVPAFCGSTVQGERPVSPGRERASFKPV